MSPPLALGGVNRTAVLTLRARADEHRREGRLFVDPVAVAWSEALPWDPALERWYGPVPQASLSTRADEIDRALAAVAAERPIEQVIELGCGLSTRWRRARADVPRWLDTDLEPVIEARRALHGPDDTHEERAVSVLDPAWIDAVEVAPERLFLIAEGLLYYLPRAEVDALFERLRARLPGATIAFDLLGPLDYPVTAAAAAAAEAPMAWSFGPPFESAWDAFGLDPLEVWPARARMFEAIDRCWARFGEAARLHVRALASDPEIACLRSGTVVGRLRPPAAAPRA
jgi:O-methyltransferase involved in polyketide biosynthesis